MAEPRDAGRLMQLDPAELRALSLPRAFRGYARGAVDQLLTAVADLLEQLEEERGQLVDAIADVRREADETQRRYEELLAAVDELERARAADVEALETLRRGVSEAVAERELLVSAVEELRSERAERQAYVERLEEEQSRGAPSQPAVTEPEPTAFRSALESALETLASLRDAARRSGDD